MGSCNLTPPPPYQLMFEIVIFQTKMLQIVYEYSLHGGLPAVVHQSSPVWHTLRPVVCNAPPPTAAATLATDNKLIYKPSSYRATKDFLIKPEEWVVVLFEGGDQQGYRPDVIYNIQRVVPALKLTLNPNELGLIVKNISSCVNIFVHKNTLLQDLLQMTIAESCFILVSKKEKQDTVSSSYDADDDIVIIDEIPLQ